ncbi:MAG: hypothetical protein IJI25_09215 [Eubacterium sp.]|nr:hypothetical protein [Eubacterium sp.]
MKRIKESLEIKLLDMKEAWMAAATMAVIIWFGSAIQKLFLISQIEIIIQIQIMMILWKMVDSIAELRIV